MHDCRGRNYTINTRNETTFQHNDQIHCSPDNMPGNIL